MDDIYLVFSSVTYALKAMSALKKAGIGTRLQKIKSIPSLGGCGYAVAVSSSLKDNALFVLEHNGLKIIEILESKDGVL